MGDIFWGLLKFQIFFWVFEIPEFFLCVKGRCWARAYVRKKIRVPPPPLIMAPIALSSNESSAKPVHLYQNAMI